MTLLGHVTSVLRREGVDFALIGAAALAAHGVSRATVDIDLLVTDPRALDFVWDDEHVIVDVRRGDADDPLAGVVRFAHPGERHVDLVVGRLQWQRYIVGRARAIDFGDVQSERCARLTRDARLDGARPEQVRVKNSLETP